MGFGDILADVAAFANPFGAPSQGQWNLHRGVFIQNQAVGVQTITGNQSNSVIFFYEDKDPNPSQHTAIDTISDTGGRRLAVFEYPYVDGQKITDLGRRGETFVFNIKFHGLNYQQLFNQFLNIVVDYNGQGTLIHPIRGAIIVRFKEYEFQHRYDEWSAITIKATFVEDNTGTINGITLKPASQDSALRSALQFLTTTQSAISNGIFEVQALLRLPAAIINGMQQRLTSILGQASGLLGQLAATFSSNAQLQNLASQSQNVLGGVTGLSSGTNQTGVLPPVYQVGFDPTTQASINSQIAAFVAANTVTPQQAVFNTNQSRNAISAAIAEINLNFGNNGYSIMVQYRGLAVALQQATEAALASTQSLVILYKVPFPMSLRTVAQKNGLSPDTQNVIEALNPYLGSVNFIPTGTMLIVPAA